MQIRCPACNGLVPLDDIDLGSRLAKCHPCGQVFSFADQVPEPGRTGLAATSHGNVPTERPRVPQPAKLQVVEDGDSLRITFRWFTPAILFLTFFCIAWDGFLVVWYTIALGGFPGGGGKGPGDAFQWLFVVFPLGHVAVGVGLTYYMLASYLNRTIITVNRDWLMVRHGPMYWPGQITLASEDVDQLYCRHKLGPGKMSSSRYHPDVHRTGGFAASLMAVTKDGREHSLWRFETDTNVVLFLEQRIEEYLGIEDRRVGGELSL